MQDFICSEADQLLSVDSNPIASVEFQQVPLLRNEAYSWTIEMTSNCVLNAMILK